MARSRVSLLTLLALAAVLCFSPCGLGWFSREETKEQLEKTVKVWKQPHNFRIVGSQFSVDTISQGAEQWQVRAMETNGSSAMFAARNKGQEVSYGINYDSSKSHWKPPLNTRVFATGISDEGDAPEWTVRVEGPGRAPKQLSVTGKGLEDVVYDASLGVERRLKRGLFWSYALDAKGRGEGWKPWIRQGLGLTYAPPAGDVNAKFNVFQAESKDPNGTVSMDWEGLLRGRLTGWSSKQGGKILSTDPQYTFRLNRDGLDARARAGAKLGTAFGAVAHVSPEGEYQAEGFAEWNNRKEVLDGVVLGADAKAVAKKGQVELQPLGVTAVAALDKLAPQLLADGSTIGLRGRMKLGDQRDRPSLAALFGLKATKLPQVSAAGSVHFQEDGVTGVLRVVAEKLKGVDARYELSKTSQGVRQAADIRSPKVDFGGGSQLRLTGKFYKGDDFGVGKPRVQLGVQYEGKVNVLGKTLDLGGDSAAFDSGRSLLDEMGNPWSSPEARKARNTASILRRRVESDFGEARRWLEK